MNYFVFDDIDTRDYSGIYVSFSNVDKTPKRVYDVAEIPARNGAFYIDKQRFEDVEHSYYVIALTKAIGSQFINDLSSKKGYHRLEDSFNTDEFYSAVFTSGADIKITSQRDKNTFKVTFTRKPQRWLASGETAVTVADGGTLDNPTPFDAEPLLAVDGYGTISFNGYEVEIENVPIGDVLLVGASDFWLENRTQTFTLSQEGYNIGDTITVNVTQISFDLLVGVTGLSASAYSATTTDSQSGFSTTIEKGIGFSTDARFTGITSGRGVEFTAGTSSTFTNIVSGTLTIQKSGSAGTANVTYSVTETIEYNATTNKIMFYLSHTESYTDPKITGVTLINRFYKSKVSSIVVFSTISAVQDTVYIDCDIGECWTIQGGEIVSLNGVISLGSDLPKLSSGTNTFTYDNTITSLEVTPRWWKV